ncbi:hypothetical protein VT50_0226415 [Streptomyces antioxidans]|uniref:Uncharacterized protein n=1 Tax=Streptomyces antioxidans TaxID=1507734 RepID=A0A1V4CZN3_9ACTN|nr:hypothetical protein [Streptomyces antioxidans]OPF74683.1 hypothetical protein VT50_0226415 [Streptomyces antioxidans]
MSSGQAIPSIGEVMPEVYFPRPPAADALQHTFQNTVPDTVQNAVPTSGVPHQTVQGTGLSDHIGSGVGQHIGDAVQHAGGHALNAAMDQLHDLMVPALIGLGSLSGALLVGRATTAGAQVLAAAAIRAAEHQAELRQRQLDARQAAECWREAAFAAVRANARIDTLRARIRRAATAAGPDGPPEPPDLPPPLALTGMNLDEVWRRLADTDRRLRRAEAAYARATMETAARPVAGAHPADTGWHTTLRARRAKALEAYEEAATETGARDVLPQPPPAATTATAATAAPSEEEVVRLGADLLATLPRQVTVADYRLVEEKVTVAAEVAAQRPAAAKRHLREAARFADRVTRDAERRGETEEWAAQQLAFLRADHPGTPVPLPDATAEIAVLERFLYRGGTLEEAERARVAARVGEQADAYQRMYAAEVIRAAVQRSEHETAGYTTSGAVQFIDWTPPGWGDGHWLRIGVDAEGTARVSTMHRERDPAEETDDDLDLDWQRCVEAPDHLRELRKLAERAGLSVPFEFDEPPARPVPRTAARPAHDHRSGPQARHRDQETQS